MTLLHPLLPPPVPLILFSSFFHCLPCLSLHTKTTVEPFLFSWRYFGWDKPTRCPSFPPFLFPTIDPSLLHFCLPQALCVRPPSSWPQPLLYPLLFMYVFQGNVPDISSGCRQCLQQAPLPVLHAVKLTPSNQVRSASFASGKYGEGHSSFQSEPLFTANLKAPSPPPPQK